jgi:hypothetical protein
MTKTTNILTYVVVAIAFFASAVFGYAQKPGTAGVEEKMLRYRYIDKENRKVNFTTPRTFSQRTYFFAGTGI